MKKMSGLKASHIRHALTAARQLCNDYSGDERRACDRGILEAERRMKLQSPSLDGIGHIYEKNLREVKQIVTRHCMKAYAPDSKELRPLTAEIAEDACIRGAADAIDLLSAREGTSDTPTRPGMSGRKKKRR